MKPFTTVSDLGDLRKAVDEALTIKQNRFAYKSLGENKTLLMVFFHNEIAIKIFQLLFKAYLLLLKLILH